MFVSNTRQANQSNEATLTSKTIIITFDMYMRGVLTGHCCSPIADIY